MALLAAGVLFLVYFFNVALGAFAESPFFGDVSEMIILFAASICFVAAILRREGEARKTTNNDNQQGETHG